MYRYSQAQLRLLTVIQRVGASLLASILVVGAILGLRDNSESLTTALGTFMIALSLWLSGWYVGPAYIRGDSGRMSMARWSIGVGILGGVVFLLGK